MVKVLMVDPPSGWKYGFPKPAPTKVENLRVWLEENGYPLSMCNDLSCCRYFTVEVDDEE